MRLATVAALALLALHPCGVVAQEPEGAEPPDMVDPALDEGDGPFDYYSRSSDVIGVMDGRGTEVTPEGWLYTGAAELIFLAGPALEPVSQRIRTLRDGWLPVVEYDVARAGVDYRLTLFAATLDGRPESARVVRASDGALRLGPDTRTVRLSWGRRAGTPAMSYDQAVDDFKREYRRRWEAWVAGRD